MESFQELGIFWVPGNEDNVCAGTLKLAHRPGNLDLELIGTLEPWPLVMVAMDTHSGYPVIFGRLHSKTLVTLTNGIILGTSVNFGGDLGTTTHLRCSYIFKGAHLPEGIETLFKRFVVRFEHLDTWADPGLPVATSEFSTGSHHFTTNPVAAVHGDAFGGTLTVSYATRTHPGREKLVVEREARLDFQSNNLRTLPDLTCQVSVPLQHFLTFACGVPVHALEFAVVQHDDESDDKRGLRSLIEVGYNGWARPAENDRPRGLRLPLSAIHDSFGDVLTKWEALHESQERSMQLLFAIALGLDLYVDTRFIFAVQAVELYHRHRWPGGVMPKAGIGPE